MNEMFTPSMLNKSFSSNNQKKNVISIGGIYPVTADLLSPSPKVGWDLAGPFQFSGEERGSSRVVGHSGR